MSKDIAEDVQTKNEIFQDSLRKATALTGIVLLLYVYQTTLIKMESHGIFSFMALFISLVLVFYTLTVNIPEFNTNIQHGIGWGLGNIILKQILH
tara:strand:+ start:506 stop:790 length:285 start_codon:yes stop_codon:yes gene_type:complete